MSPRKLARYFISYAQVDAPLVDDLIVRISPHLAASKRYEFIKWRNTADLLVGEDWDDAVVAALNTCRLGLLLLSPTFMVRPYILTTELPRLREPDKLALPVLLKPIAFDLQDALGLEKLQIFALTVKHERRAYAELSAGKRDEFAFELYKAIEARLARDF